MAKSAKHLAGIEGGKPKSKPYCAPDAHQKAYSLTVVQFKDGTHERHPQFHWICRKCLKQGCGFTKKHDQRAYDRTLAFKYGGTEAVQ